MIKEIKKELKNLANSEKAALLQRFFNTGKGEYGEGDVFLGIMVPQQREIAKKYCAVSLKELEELVKSRIHEFRLTGFIILNYKYQKADEKERKKIFDFYIANKRYANNWDIVDVTAPKVIGKYLLDKDRKILYRLAKSKSLWDKRIAIISTFEFIRNNQFEDSLEIAEMLLKDKHDLIHKAVGWVLREIGKKNQAVEEKFLKKHYKTMPRTMLRYAIEKFDEKKRRFYLDK